MTPLVFRILRKACIGTVFLSLTLLLLLITDTNHDENNAKATAGSIQPKGKDSSHSGSSSLSSSRLHLHSTQRLRLPTSHFKVLDASDFSQPNSVQANNSHNDNYKNGNIISTQFNCTLSQSQPSFTICVYQTTKDRFISKALLTSGIWEPYITSAFQTALSRHPDASVIDIGANIGYYSLMASSRGHDVIAIEPSRENQRRLLAGSALTSRQHPGTGRVLLLGNAMSDGHRLVGLSSSKDNQGGLRILEDCRNTNGGIMGFVHTLFNPGLAEGDRVSYTNDNGEKLARPCDITTVTLDDLLPVLNTHKAAIIKVDVEGYECKALGKATKLFSALSVPYIFTEWRLMTERQRDLDTACPAHRIRQLSQTLSSHGYVPHEVQSGIRLNPDSASKWKVGDVYWRKKEHNLLVPSM